MCSNVGASVVRDGPPRLAPSRLCGWSRRRDGEIASLATKSCNCESKEICKNCGAASRSVASFAVPCKSAVRADTRSRPHLRLVDFHAPPPPASSTGTNLHQRRQPDISSHLAAKAAASLTPPPLSKHRKNRNGEGALRQGSTTCRRSSGHRIAARPWIRRQSCSRPAWSCGLRRWPW